VSGGADPRQLHRAAAVGFARSADAYERGRPEYPQAAIDFVRGQLPGRRVLDLAAGTGKLTRPLVEAGLDVVAVEPVAEMRALLRVPAFDGTAEAIPLGDGSVDGVTVGQGFHWFDGDAALAEIARVLVRGGLLALLWNRRVEDEPVNAAIEEIIGPYRADTPSHRGSHWRDAFSRTDAFSPLEETIFDHRQEADADALEARVASISFIAALDPAERAPLLERARAIAGGGSVTIPYRTEVHTARLC
jgi:ubiquinone/menaquinone biosynthesis C-methylase UbiE